PARLESSTDEARCDSRCGRALGPGDAGSAASRGGTQFARVLAPASEGAAFLPTQGAEGGGRDDPPVAGTCWGRRACPFRHRSVRSGSQVARPCTALVAVRA